MKIHRSQYVSLILHADCTWSVREHRQGDGTPVAIWHGRDVSIAMPSPCTHDLVQSFVADHAEDIARFRAGHTVVWDGSSHVGSDTDSASESLDRLRAASEALESDIVLWSAAEWCRDNSDESLGITPTLRAHHVRKIARLAEILHSEARADGVEVNGLEVEIERRILARAKR